MEIQQAHDAPLGERLGERFEFVELACRIAAADDGPDGAAGNHVRHDAGLVDRPHDADMRPSSGGAAAKGKADFQSGARLAIGHVIHGRRFSSLAGPRIPSDDPIPEHG